MSIKNHSDQPTLEARLIREAAERSPDFSVALHVRIMQRVHSAPGGVIPKRNIRPWLPRTAAAIGIAAGIAGIIAVPTWNWRHVQSKREVVIAATPAVPSVPQIGPAVAMVSEPATQQLMQARYAYLDRDAARFTHYMMEQVDVLPHGH